jgi:hypothetical protein
MLKGNGDSNELLHRENSDRLARSARRLGSSRRIGRYEPIIEGSIHRARNEPMSDLDGLIPDALAAMRAGSVRSNTSPPSSIAPGARSSLPRGHERPFPSI